MAALSYWLTLQPKVVMEKFLINVKNSGDAAGESSVSLAAGPVKHYSKLSAMSMPLMAAGAGKPRWAAGKDVKVSTGRRQLNDRRQSAQE